MIKKLSHISLLLFITFIAQISHAEIPENLKPGFNTLSIPTLHQNITYLSSNSLEGRLALEKGDEAATQWIKNQFKNIGLMPLYQGTYLQPVKLIKYFPDIKNNTLTITTQDKTLTFAKPQVLTDFYQNIELSGDVVFSGYGITAPDLNYDDYQNINVRGKIVLVFEHEPQENNRASVFDGIANTIYATNRIKALNAQAHGAIAILISPEANRKHPSNLERYLKIGGSLERKTPIAAMVLADDELHIPVAVISDSVAKQIAGNAISLSLLQAKIDQKFKPQSQLIPNVKASLHEQNKSVESAISYNVVGLIPGSDPILKNETILISAHHDHDGKSAAQIFHGADDNASGTVGVVALAQAIAKNSDLANGLRPKRSILFVVFAAEERGLLGSYYYVAHPLRPLATTRAMLNFDMIGRDEVKSPQTDGIINIPNNTGNRLNFIGSHYSPDYRKRLEAQNQIIGLDLDYRFDNESVLNGLFRSDQFPFILHQVPAFWWFTGFHKDYHHDTDTADKINYEKMLKILQLAYLTTYDFADGDAVPVFIKNPGLKN